MSLTLQNQTQSQTRVRNSRSELVQYQYFTKFLNLNLEHSNSVRLSQIHQCWWHCRIRIRVRPESDQSQTRVRTSGVGHPGVNDIVESDSHMSMTLRSQNFVCIYYITTMSNLFENILAYKKEVHRRIAYPNVYTFCVRQFMQFSLFRSYSLFFSFSIYFLLGFPLLIWDANKLKKESKEARMRLRKT